MQDLTKRELFLVAILAIIGLIINYRIGLGILLGYAFSVLHYQFLKYRVNSILNQREVSIFAYIGSILGIGLLALPIWISFLCPQLFHWAGVLVGLIYRKMAMYGKEAVRKV